MTSVSDTRTHYNLDNFSAEVIEDEFLDSESSTRWSITLPSGRSLIIDDRFDNTEACDVWVIFPGSLGTTVAIGDTPEEGFATFYMQQ